MKRSALIRTGQGILDRAIRESRALRPAEDVDLGGIELKIGDIDRTLNRFTTFNRNGGDASMTFVRCVCAFAASRGNLEGAGRWASGQRHADVTRALSVSVATDGGFAVPDDYSREIIEALRPLVAVRKLNPTIITIPHGNFHWPRINVAGQVGYIGENATVPNTQPAFGQLALSAKKLAAQVPISNTLLRSSRPAADLIVRQDLVASMATTEDYNFLRGTGGQYTPTGLRGWVLPANTITSNPASSLASVDTDLASLEYALINANSRMVRPAWILSPRSETFLRTLRGSGGAKAYPEMDGGMLRGKPFASTTNVPVNLGAGSDSEIYLADFADVVIGEVSELIIDASTGGTYPDANGNPVSAFSQDQTIVRVIAQHDIGMRHDQSIAVLTAVKY
jgi:HK97 family phage major capsid protein